VIIQMLKFNELNVTNNKEKEMVIREVLGQKQDIKVKKHQMRVLSIGLLIYMILFFSITILADYFLFPSGGFECINSLFYRPLSEKAALFVLILNIISLSSTPLFWYTMYFIPMRYGKISMAAFHRKIIISSNSVDSLLIQDQE
jgi:hypothetical protein